MKKPYMHTIIGSSSKAEHFKVICSEWVNINPPHDRHIGRRANPI